MKCFTEMDQKSIKIIANYQNQVYKLNRIDKLFKSMFQFRKTILLMLIYYLKNL